MSSHTLDRPIAPDVLERVAKDHLSYELEQMSLGAFRATPANDGHLGNAVLEAFLVHVRVLDEFLGKATPRGEDILAVDYCSTWEAKYALDSPVRLEIDRRVAHLTARRSNAFEWTDVRGRLPLATAINQRFTEFFSLLKGEDPERAAWIEPGFRTAQALLSGGAGGSLAALSAQPRSASAQLVAATLRLPRSD